jgi:hypothetical protein
VIVIAIAEHVLNMASETESSSVATLLRLRLKEMIKQKQEHMVSGFRFKLATTGTTLAPRLWRLVTRTFGQNVSLARP